MSIILIMKKKCLYYKLTLVDCMQVLGVWPAMPIITFLLSGSTLGVSTFSLNLLCDILGQLYTEKQDEAQHLLQHFTDPRKNTDIRHTFTSAQRRNHSGSFDGGRGSRRLIGKN